MNPQKKIFVGGMLSEEEHVRLIPLLSETRYNFVFQHFEMPGIDLMVISHRLQVELQAKLVK